MSLKPRIYTVNSTCVLGRLGENTQEIAYPTCPKCGRMLQSGIRYSALEYVFDEYHGEDLFTARNALIVSQRLYQELYASDITGFAPIKVITSISEQCSGDPIDGALFYYLGILNSSAKNTPLGYDIEGTCDTCGNLIVSVNFEKLQHLVRSSSENQLPLEVQYDSWNGDDLFYCRDHTELIATEKAVSIFRSFNCPELVVIPSQWV